MWLVMAIPWLISCEKQSTGGDGSGGGNVVAAQKRGAAENPGDVLPKLLKSKLGATNVVVLFSDENQVMLTCDQPGEPAKRTWMLSYRGYKIPEGNSEQVSGIGQSATWANERDIGLVVRIDADRSFCLVTYRNDSLIDVTAAHADPERGGRWKKEAIGVGREIASRVR